MRALFAAIPAIAVRDTLGAYGALLAQRPLLLDFLSLRPRA